MGAIYIAAQIKQRGGQINYNFRSHIKGLGVRHVKCWANNKTDKHMHTILVDTHS